jgi:hypothetical protein
MEEMQAKGLMWLLSVEEPTGENRGDMEVLNASV